MEDENLALEGRLSDLDSGGPAGIIYSFIVVWVGNLFTFASLAELASMYAPRPEFHPEIRS